MTVEMPKRQDEQFKCSLGVLRIPGTHLSISNYEEDINTNPRVELNGQSELA